MPKDPQLPNVKLAEDLDQLDEDLQKLQVLYEKYFLGIDRKPPDKERKQVAETLRRLRAANVRNTGLRFRINTLFAKLLSFERMWDRTLSEIEAGTYKRDVYKAKWRQKQKAPAAEGATAAASPGAPNPSPQAAAAAAGGPVPPRVELGDDKLRKLYDTYLIARQRTGESTEGLSYESVSQRIRSQIPTLLEKYNAKSVEFKVVIKAGKAVLKAVPKGDEPG